MPSSHATPLSVRKENQKTRLSDLTPDTRLDVMPFFPLDFFFFAAMKKPLAAIRDANSALQVAYCLYY